ncbi:FG-GAP repeat domain-containing protein [Streptomyces sp. NPDC056543]|uniref:FG-GAP repeat domain-containing protein n=1 Tax=unclassified Streptomyces TaxID=2593676 RepID=UPI0036AF4537
MSRARTPRFRRTAAATVTLAVAAGILTTAPATAVAGTVSAGTAPAAPAQQEVLTMPAGTGVVTSGPTGFLASYPEGTARAFVWTRHADGVQTRLPGQRYGGSAGTDIVIRHEGTTRTFIDMSTGTELATLDTSTLGGTYTVHRYMRNVMVASTYVNDVEVPHLFSKDDQGRTIDRKLSGLPEGAAYMRFEAGTPDTLIVHYVTGQSGAIQHRVALVDVASASVVETYDALWNSSASASAVSATHVAWVEWPTSGRPTLAVVRRGGTEIERTPLGEGYSMTVKLVGDWVVYGATGGGASSVPVPLGATTALSLKTGEKVGLLDHVSYATQSHDHSLIVTGGTVGQGEGLYRIAPDQTGKPAASLLVTTGVPTVLTLKSETVPSGVIDVDRNGRSLSASWTFNRHNANASLLLRHTASGSKWSSLNLGPRKTAEPFTFTWNGTLGDGGLPAYTGDYTWTMTATPANGVGPAVVRTGGFTLARAPRPHDFNDNGTPDLLVRNWEGRLTAFDGEHVLNTTATHVYQPWALGTGWKAYDLISAAGDIAGTTAGDLVARDATGVLWLHQGKGSGVAPRTKVGGGWQIYGKLTAGSDLTGDGRPDLVAADKAGALYLYRGTGNATAPFGPRTKIGGGWGIYNQLTATGNIGGAGAGDLVARDNAGVLWLYLGKGDGTFAARTRIGGGWNQYADLVGVGDTDHDGRNDLIAYYPQSTPVSSLYVYKGTGEAKAPFAPRRALYNHQLYNHDPQGLGLSRVGHSLY